MCHLIFIPQSPSLVYGRTARSVLYSQRRLAVIFPAHVPSNGTLHDFSQHDNLEIFKFALTVWMVPEHEMPRNSAVALGFACSCI